jgi:hypothetical protein
VAIELGDLVIELLDPTGERSERELRGFSGLAEAAVVWAQTPAERRLAACRLARRELVAQIDGSGDQQL